MTSLLQARPRVLVSPCLGERDGHAGYWVDAKYLEAVRLAGADPWLLPGCTEEDLARVLDEVDGVLLTGSPSNVNPALFGEVPRDAAQPLDPARDAWTLPLIRLAVQRGVPLFGICRGLQEMNVALGGSLHQAVAERPLALQHLNRAAEGPDDLYAAAHAVSLQPGGCLRDWLARDSVDVNSVHFQGVARLAPGVRVEALAPDGLVEAFSVPTAPSFALAVQWHPEWNAADDEVSSRLWRAFGAACLQRLRQRGVAQPREPSWSTRNN